MHIGFIMDGNRRWAKKLGNLASFGHRNGFTVIEPVLDMCLDAGIACVSMWGLSKENITERSSEEIATLFDIIENQVRSLAVRLRDKLVRFDTVWDLSLLPASVQTALAEAKDITREGTVMTAILAVAYSGQDEIVRGIKKCISAGVDLLKLTEKEFLSYLDTGAYPPPDLIVRTGGRNRHSGYFLYQSAYSEYFFTDTLWPDFSAKDFEEALNSYRASERNFGK